jgi:bifunctional UDP-N-acetylglucosamine pyrophosphorylase/glucosamine-1-phosphate N-acetyltransferase
VSQANVALVVLAAGSGTRMRSSLPKPLHPIVGRSMIEHVLRAASAVSPISTTIVISPDNDAVIRAELGSGIGFATQAAPLGTGDAVKAALPLIGPADRMLVLFADHPLLTPTTVQRLVSAASEQSALVTALTCVVDDVAGYGRIERDVEDRVTRVIERKDDDPARRLGRAEINSGMMAIDADWARTALPRISPSPVTGEYYLPELVRLAVEDAAGRQSWPVQTVSGELDELLGVNNRVELAAAEAVLRQRIRERHLDAGVTLVSPETIVIDDDVTIGEDTAVLPFSYLRAGTTIGSGCEIGPHATIQNAKIGDRVRVTASTVVDSTMESDTDIGPYSHLRGGVVVRANAHVGNFVEMKNTDFGESARSGHFSYLGDAKVGARSNIGAGTVTCNFDGVNKHVTEIGEAVFIGSDTMLVAPISIGDQARTGAGSVVNRDVAAGVTVVGVPARPIKSKPLEQDEE